MLMAVAIAAKGQIDSGSWDRNSEIDLIVKQSLARIVSQMKIDTVICLDTAKVVVFYRKCKDCRIRKVRGYRYNLTVQQHRKIDNVVLVSPLLDLYGYVYWYNRKKIIPKSTIVGDRIIKSKKQ